MNDSHLLVSVIIPVYNGERYLSAAIESVLAQNYRPLEIIVVDDGSTDDSAAVAKRFPAHYVWQAQSGASAARNHGIALAQGEFLAFLDADDLWVEDKLQCQTQALATDPELAMVFGQVEQFYSPEITNESALPDLGTRHTLAGVHVGAMLIRRRAFTQVEPFDPQWQVAHFIEWYTRAQKIGLKSLILPQVVMKRRIHTTNLGIRAYIQARQEYVRLTKATLDQRRLAIKQGREP
ncbi:MAG: glycosyltransferase family A protein [Caldilineaceae bacterium]